MKEENKNLSNESIDAFPIPEGSVILENYKILNLSQLAILAIKKLINERGINLKLKNTKKVTDQDCILELNNFTIQIVFTGISSDNLVVPLKRWYKIKGAPQIILAASIDEENNIVFFKGIITAKEFINTFLERNARNQSYEISLDKFQGGIDKLFNYVQILDPKALSSRGLTSKTNTKVSIFKKIGFSKRNISIATAAAGIIIFGPYLFRPRLLGNIASIQISQIEIAKYTRGIDQEKTLNLCLFTPRILLDNSTSTQIANTSIDQPLIFSPDPLNEITISKNGKILWSKNSSFDKKIDEPIPWPISPITSNEEYLLTIRPEGTVLGEEAKFILRGSTENSLVKLGNLIEKLGDNEKEWNKAINKLIKEDSNTALALLFSNKAPQSKIINKARRLILEREGCLK